MADALVAARLRLYIDKVEYDGWRARPRRIQGPMMNLVATTDPSSAMPPVADLDSALPDMAVMAESAQDAAGLLKALAHEGRLMILCALVEGERSVGELEDLLGARQAAVSQQLARLRIEGLVTCRREGKQVVYALGDTRVARIVAVLHDIFCAAPQPA
jgi:DNA-binding transcriptional ArsR family regulator